MNDKTILMVMVDAFRHDYVLQEDAPFLFNMAEKYAHGSLIPSFGFEPDGAYFSGLDPEECDGGAQYWRNPDERVFYLTRLFKTLDWVPLKWWRKNIRKGLRLVAQLAAQDTLTRKLAPANEIPLSILDQFSFPMKKFAYEPGFTPSPTVFDALRDNGKNFHFHGHPAYRVKIEAVTERYLREDNGGNDLAFLFIGDLDGIGHHFGPDSQERRNMLKHVDDGIRQIYEHATKCYNEVDLLVFGDHGMVEVTNHIDLHDAIKEAKLHPTDDSYFLDSTFARFWVPDDSRKSRLIKLLDFQQGGHVLKEDEIERFRIRYPHNYFGDVIFVVDDAALIHPSYYSTDSSPPIGMHGYLPGCRDNESAFVMASSKTSGSGNLGRIDMRRIFPTLLDLLNLTDKVNTPHNLTGIIT